MQRSYSFDISGIFFFIEEFQGDVAGGVPAAEVFLVVDAEFAFDIAPQVALAFFVGGEVEDLVAGGQDEGDRVDDRRLAGGVLTGDQGVVLDVEGFVGKEVPVDQADLS